MEESPGDLERRFTSEREQELDPTDALYVVKPETPVVDRDGDEIGKVVRVYRPVTVDEMGSQATVAYIRVGHRGFPGLADDLYIPSDVVESVDDQHVRLSVDRDVIPDMAWDRPYNIARDEDE
ncbi:MAG TPA: hypothetical protein VFI42_05335 [Thermomicrobiaceae bacterium]|nr:hypothetical protein [Thermomicrobiaceae bacterium]